MSDPLSVAASIAGLIAITGKVGAVLKSFVSSLHGAPESARRALASMEAMRGILESAKSATDNLAGLPRSRKQMVHYRNIAVVFRESVIAFSELEATVGIGAAADWAVSTWDRTKWALHEGSVQRYISKMESLMGSLSLMLNILQCDLFAEAQESQRALTLAVDALVNENRNIPVLIDAIMSRHIDNLLGAGSIRHTADDDSFIETGSVLRDREADGPLQLTTDNNHCAWRPLFENELENSRVYARVRTDAECDVSFRSSFVGSAEGTMLSNVSLNDISIISAIGVPVTAQEIGQIASGLTFSPTLGTVDEEVQIDTTTRDDALQPIDTTTSTAGPHSPKTDADAASQHSGEPSRRAVVSHAVSRFLTRLQNSEPRRYARQRQVEQTSAADKLVLYKLVVLGDGGVGKTALTIQLCLSHVLETYDPTIEDSYRKQVVIDGRACMLEVLDTAGQEEYTALRDQWIRDGEGFVFVYSISSRSSFTRIKKFHHLVSRVKESSRAWETRNTAGHPSISSATPRREFVLPPMMLVGNKCHRVMEREVSIQEGHALARELGCMFVEASDKIASTLRRRFSMSCGNFDADGEPGHKSLLTRA